MEKTEAEIGEIVLRSLSYLRQRFTHEVLAETKYRDPLMKPERVELLAGWKFTEYVRTN